MYDTLGGKLQGVFKNLRGHGKISDSNVAESLREVRMSLLDADVNFKVAKDFIERVKEKAIGEKVAYGEYLGVMGSSGNSTGPHLHLEIYDAFGALVEPFVGPCHTLAKNPSWLQQPLYYDTDPSMC